MCIVPVPAGSLLVMSVVLSCIPMSDAFNVDTRAITAKGPNGSYFGFSVGLVQNKHGTWLLVGAPRANSTHRQNITEPGALMKCLVRKGQAGPCTEVILDTTGNIWHSSYRYLAMKDNQWLGGSFDVRPGLQDEIVVCAHTWRDSKYSNFHYLANGFCFLIPGSLEEDNVKELLLLLDNDKQIDGTGRFLYGMALAGFATHYTQDGMLLLGAPGLKYSTGGFLTYTEASQVVMESFDDQDSYYGYAVSSGRFYDGGEEYYVVGGPNANAVGKVYILDRNFTILQQFSGNQIRCQFGAALAVVDLNDDGFDDLIIGAPYYRELADEGRAFIYMNQRGIFSEKVTLKLSGSNSMKALFGSSMGSLGDINRDGYVDIVIGAPYEDDMQGAIYIYNGYERGLREQFSQRIAAVEIGDGFQGFGISFSRPMDVDRNGYHDFAVGSYVSGHAMILRSMPVADVVLNLTIAPALIDLSRSNCEYLGNQVTCVVVKTCFYYHGFWVPKTINIEYMIRVETLDAFEDDMGRIHLLIDGGLTNVYRGTDTLKYSEDTCRSFTAIAWESRDLLTPVRFELSYNLLDTTESVMGKLRGKPGIVLNCYQNATIYSEAMFAHECGADNVCQEDLHLVTKFVLPANLSYIIAGQDTIAWHRLVISNNGEPAYFAKIIIEYPIQIQYISTVTNGTSKEIICSRLSIPFYGDSLAAMNNDTYLIACDVSNPLINGTSLAFTISIDISGTNLNIQSLEIRLWTSSIAARVNLTLLREAEHVSDSILVRPKSAILITGYSDPEELMFKDANIVTPSGVNASWRAFSHVYVIQNTGPSAFPQGSMIFTLTTDEHLSILQENVLLVEATISDPLYERDTVCRALYTPAKTERPGTRIGLDEEQRRQFVDVNIVRKRRQIVAGHKISSGNNACRGLACLLIYCSHAVIQMDDSFTIILRFKVSSSIFQNIGKSEILLQTHGELQVPADALFLSDESTLVQQVSTLVGRAGDVKTVDIWLVVASGVSSFIALLLISVLLWKAGFFKRKHRDERRHLLLLDGETARKSITTTDLPDDSCEFPDDRTAAVSP